MGLAIPNIYGSTPAGTFSYYGGIYSQLINSESNKAKLQLLNTSTGKFKFIDLDKLSSYGNVKECWVGKNGLYGFIFLGKGKGHFYQGDINGKNFKVSKKINVGGGGLSLGSDNFNGEQEVAIVDNLSIDFSSGKFKFKKINNKLSSSKTFYPLGDGKFTKQLSFPTKWQLLNETDPAPFPDNYYYIFKSVVENTFDGKYSITPVSIESEEEILKTGIIFAQWNNKKKKWGESEFIEVNNNDSSLKKLSYDHQNKIFFAQQYVPSSAENEIIFFDFNGKEINVGNSKANKYKGGAKVDLFRGLGGNDKIDGKNGNDSLWGDKGNDFLVGGKGKDKLTGGIGKDIFKLTKGSGFDLIQDFEDKKDKIFIGSFKKLNIKNKGKNVYVYKGKDLLAKVKGAKGDLSKKGKYLV